MRQRCDPPARAQRVTAVRSSGGKKRGGKVQVRRRARYRSSGRSAGRCCNPGSVNCTMLRWLAASRYKGGKKKRVQKTCCDTELIPARLRTVCQRKGDEGHPAHPCGTRAPRNPTLLFHTQSVVLFDLPYSRMCGERKKKKKKKSH